MQKLTAILLALLLALGMGPGFLLAADPADGAGNEAAPVTGQPGEVQATAGAAAGPGDINAKGAILMDPQTGEILWEKNSHAHYYPASMTKLMTMVVAMDMVANGQATLDEPVQVSERAESFGGSEVFLAVGETFPLEQMLIAIAVASANDAAVAVAEHLAGSEEAFVAMMNAKAKELGLKDTHFANCHGLHDEQNYTSAYDMAVIARYALKYLKIREWTSIKRYTLRKDPLTILDTTNKMLYWYPGTDGFKTGFTDAAGLNLVSTVERDGLRLVAVVMGVETPQGHFTESMKLYNWAFKQWAFKEFYGPGQVVASIPVGKGQVEQVKIVTTGKVGARISRLRGKAEGVTTKVELPGIVNAPVKEGQVVGQALVLRDGQVIDRVQLVTQQKVAKASLGQEIVRVIRAVFTIRQ
ncbi:D-alanyl-D-alanine carboxypeptidase DacF [Moorella thermoacetica]|uniref:D-alanyl-D-alanine carboxypeptidase family protein n=1 Tax=Neomoorella thermoacetica TaxID=1525 RepID=UPI0011E62365|nr:D-alanyl-D-alanine carboxypeptidase family protein [Moorella thermoacetica]TYL12506.1 D-alanyl-D-alanine carboxypeptidase DacF [Moorella thermoacetica]